MAPLLVASLVLSLICLQFGTQWIGLSQIIDIVGQVLREWTVESDRIGTTGVILIQVRLPRVLLGFLVGACLASVGVVLQALLRNPLADPYVLGVSSGAA
ncbi:MAG TPA: iron chelate uptake ABC transporter family permease subunit, partial [Nitrospiraceae bacterium]|nr:iron chelate uptake ABC transporter family permease subunit [Nitrospiraceae bacterium]